MAPSDNRAPRPTGSRGKAKDKKQAGPAKQARAASSRPAPKGRTASGRKNGGGARKPAKRLAAKPAKRSAAKPAQPAQGAQAASRARPARGSGTGKRRAAPRKAAVTSPPSSEPVLSDEEVIESAKYLPVASQPRVFEEERFLFPESYGENRLRLHVKDPEWLFAHWDVDPGALAKLRDEVGERAMALSRVTLRVVDTGNGGASVILLPPGARSWYVRTAQGRRSYRAQLGVTLPSGEFRSLAESNTVIAPRGAPSAERASEKRSYRQARAQSAAATAAAARAESAVAPGGEPWSVPPQDAGEPITPAETRKPRAVPGGASDVFRR
jgi:hypothetical protein